MTGVAGHRSTALSAIIEPRPVLSLLPASEGGHPLGGHATLAGTPCALARPSHTSGCMGWLRYFIAAVASFAAVLGGAKQRTAGEAFPHRRMNHFYPHRRSRRGERGRVGHLIRGIHSSPVKPCPASRSFRELRHRRVDDELDRRSRLRRAPRRRPACSRGDRRARVGGGSRSDPHRFGQLPDSHRTL